MQTARWSPLNEAESPGLPWQALEEGSEGLRTRTAWADFSFKTCWPPLGSGMTSFSKKASASSKGLVGSSLHVQSPMGTSVTEPGNLNGVGCIAGQASGSRRARIEESVLSECEGRRGSSRLPLAGVQGQAEEPCKAGGGPGVVNDPERGRGG